MIRRLGTIRGSPSVALKNRGQTSANNAGVNFYWASDVFDNKQAQIAG